MTKIVKIEGMSCNHCVMHVKKALMNLKPDNVLVSLEQKQAVVSSKKEISNQSIMDAVNEIGYQVIGIE
jgi:copper chaperone CopZ